MAQVTQVWIEASVKMSREFSGTIEYKEPIRIEIPAGIDASVALSCITTELRKFEHGLAWELKLASTDNKVFEDARPDTLVHQSAPESPVI